MSLPRIKQREISSIQSAGLYCPDIYNALSLSAVLRHSHSVQRVEILTVEIKCNVSQKYIDKHI